MRQLFIDSRDRASGTSTDFVIAAFDYKSLWKLDCEVCAGSANSIARGDSGQLCVKNSKGQVIRPSLKQWGEKTPKAMPYTSTKEPQKPCLVPMASHSQTCRPAFSSQLRPRAVKRLLS